MSEKIIFRKWLENMKLEEDLIKMLTKIETGKLGFYPANRPGHSRCNHEFYFWHSYPMICDHVFSWMSVIDQLAS